MRYLLFLTSFLILFSSCLKEPKQHSYQQIVDDIYASFKDVYGNFETRPDFDSLYSVTSSGLNPSMSDGVFFDHLVAFLGGLEDPHISLKSEHTSFQTFDLLGYPDIIDVQRIYDNYIVSGFESNDVCTYGLMVDNIGYLYLPNFSQDTIHTSLPSEVETAWQMLMSTEGLIIDLRYNDGGQAFYAKELLGRFTQTSYLWHSSQNRTAAGFDDLFDWYIEPDDEYYYPHQVVVISGYETVSAGERFLLGAKALPNMTIVGTRSAGTQGAVIGKEALNGWKYTLTYQKVFGADGVNYDYIGVPPDVEVTDSVSSFPPGVDPYLEAALNILQ